MTMLATLTWALCPHIRQAACKRCPATVATEYGAGKQVCRGLAEDAARAAIEAMREPSDGMMAAAERAMDNIPRTGVVPENVERALEGWQATIDAILAEPTDIP